MKSIILTERHKTKLLEMCTALFPELGSVQFGVRENHNWSRQYLVFGIEKSDEDTFVIHWFEFVMIHLVDKIYYPNDSDGKRDTRAKVEFFFFQTFVDCTEGATSGYDHPIDYLYKVFKQIPEWKSPY